MTVGGAITDGRYSIPAAAGLQPGHYVVRVSPAGAPPREGFKPAKELPKRDQPFESEREITGENIQIDIELPE